jgi:hypothetical protein
MFNILMGSGEEDSGRLKRGQPQHARHFFGFTLSDSESYVCLDNGKRNGKCHGSG